MHCRTAATRSMHSIGTDRHARIYLDAKTNRYANGTSPVKECKRVFKYKTVYKT